ncbi:MAG: hypothetical protein AAB393_15730 [Bacteroidota bacterium]
MFLAYGYATFLEYHRNELRGILERQRQLLDVAIKIAEVQDQRVPEMQTHQQGVA